MKSKWRFIGATVVNHIEKRPLLAFGDSRLRSKERTNPITDFATLSFFNLRKGYQRPYFDIILHMKAAGNFPSRVRELRQRFGMTQIELAKRVRVTQTGKAVEGLAKCSLCQFA